MKLLFIGFTLFTINFTLFSILLALNDANELREKEILLQQMQIISTQCPGKSGSVDFETGDLRCDNKKQAETKRFRPKAMPNTL